MSQISVTLPDGSSRSVPAGTTVGDLATSISPGLAKAALAGKVGDRLVDLTYPLTADAPIQIITSKNARRLFLFTATAPRTCWPRPSRTCSPACSAASVRRPTKGSSTTSSCRARSCPRTSRRSRRRCASSRSRICSYERQMWPREEAKRFFGSRGEPLKVQLIDEKTEGQTRGLLLHDQGQGDVRRLLRRPARAVHRKAEGVQAAHHVERVLEGRRAQPADAARLRHRVPLREGAPGAPHAHRGSEEARPPEDRPRPEAVHVPPVGAGRDVLAREGHDALQHARRLHARRAHPRRLHRGEGADRLQQGAVGDLRPLAALPRRTCSSSSPKASRWGSRR